MRNSSWNTTENVFRPSRQIPLKFRGNWIPNIDIDRDQGKIYARYLKIKKENSLAEKYPELLMEWDYTKNQINPNMIPAASNKKVFWRCANGHEWSARVESRMLGHGCPICAGKKVLAGYNDLSTLNPDLAKEWHPTKNGQLLPTDVTVRSGKKSGGFVKMDMSGIPLFIPEQKDVVVQSVVRKNGMNHERILCLNKRDLYKR